jgi:hypothetical protein
LLPQCIFVVVFSLVESLRPRNGVPGANSAIEISGTSMNLQK